MFLHLPVFLPLQVPFFDCVLCSLRLDLEYTCTLNRVTFISSMSDCWEQELQQCLEANLDFAPGDFIARHPEVAPPTIRRRHASLRNKLRNRLKKGVERGVQSSSMANLNTPQAQADKGATGGARNTPQAQAAKGPRNTPQAQAAKSARNTPQAQAAKGARNTPQAQAAKGASNTPQAQATKGATNTPQAKAAKGATNTPQAQAAKGARNTPHAQAAKGAKNTPQAQAAKGARNTPQAQAAKGSTWGVRNTRQAQAAKGSRNTPQAQVAKGYTGGARNTPEAQRDKGIVGGHSNTPEKQYAKASHARSPGVVGAAKKKLFRGKHTQPSRISLKSVREYWLDGLDVLYSPLFDALCHQCGQLLWGPVGAHKFLVFRDDSAVRTTNLFGVPTTVVITSAIFEFRNDLFANYVQYKEPPFRVPPRLHPTSIGPFKVYDTPVWHLPHGMYACLVCSKYRAKYDPINYGYKLDGTTHYRVPTKLANLTEYQKRQIALGALYSNTLKHVDLCHRQWHHAIGTAGVGCKPSQQYNALYGFMTMKEDVLRDYQKPKDSAQNTRQMNQALLLLKKIHPFYSRFLAHYETLYRYLQNAASTRGR